MTRIDLIPPEVVEKHKARRLIGVVGAGFSVVVIILIVIYALLTGQVIMASNRIDKINQQNKQVQAYIKKLKPYEDRKKAVDERKTIVGTVTENQMKWSSVLNDISMVLPNDVWLKQITIDINPILSQKESTTAAAAETKTPPIKLIGYAFDHAAVARLLVHLSEIDQFRSVWLDYATEQDISTSTSSTTAGGSSTAGTAAKLTVIEFQTTVYLTKFSEDTKGQTTP
ncbi:MAG: PilN domain-containing protein [Actinomycetota bacterium]